MADLRYEIELEEMIVGDEVVAYVLRDFLAPEPVDIFEFLGRDDALFWAFNGEGFEGLFYEEAKDDLVMGIAVANPRPGIRYIDRRFKVGDIISPSTKELLSLCAKATLDRVRSVRYGKIVTII